MALPKFIALCGRPGSGKSTVQEILRREYHVHPVDDGWPLRDIGIRYYNLSSHQVCSQEGKKEMVEILGKDWQVRQFLGELGNKFEEMFGDHAMPYMVTNTLIGPGPYSFGSVRKTQGWFYKKMGGIVVEVQRPGIPESPYAFDKYDQSAVDFVLHNDGTEEELLERVAQMVDKISTKEAA